MANMLIRTRHLQWKHRVAVIIRVVLFFGIPTCYLLLGGSADGGDDIQQVGIGERVPSRHLMATALDKGKNCTPAAILEFPPDGFTRSQRQHGFIFIHCLVALYGFLLLGAVCEEYFVPAIGIICDKLNMAEDIAGATFMAAASSSPELFINCVGTFVTEGDLGVGAIVGSAVFNVLAVPACCGILASKAIDLDWWSVSRDCLMYAVAVVALILTLLDDMVCWQEALLLVLMYIFYILAMVFNGKLSRFVRSGCCGFNKPKPYTEVTPLLAKEKALASPRFVNGSYAQSNLVNGSSYTNLNGAAHHHMENGTAVDAEKRSVGSDLESSTESIWSWPGEKSSTFSKLYWMVTWPIRFLLWTSIPDCRNHPNLVALCFMMCIAWIATVSYLEAWIITVIGDTLNLPDSITGLTILAAGTSLPEAISSVVVTNQGHGSMGISNSIGSNTFDILLCLGLPWLIKSLFYPATPDHHWVTINSSGISYSAISLLSTLFALYGCLALNKFSLDWRVGVTCAVIYLGFVILAALLELNVFFVVNLPVCPH